MPRTYPIVIPILVVVLALVIVLSSTLLLHGYLNISDLALKATNDIATEVSAKTVERVRADNQRVIDMISASEEISTIYQSPKLEVLHPAFSHFTRTLIANPSLYAVYIGFGNGDFFEVIRIGAWKKMLEKPGVPKSAIWATITIAADANGVRTKVWTYFDVQFDELAKTVEKEPAYDPRQRPWYKKAIADPDIIRTPPYVYATLQAPGVTFAKHMNLVEGAVLGADIALSTLSEFLAKQKVTESSETFLFNRQGQIIAFPDENKGVKWTKDAKTGKTQFQLATISDLGIAVYDEILRRVKESGWSGMETLSVGGRSYITSVTRLDMRMLRDEYLASVTPMDEVVKPFLKIGKESLLTSAGILILFIPVFWFGARGISRRITAMAEETERISQLEFSGVAIAPSRIKEINQLSTSISTMASTIGAYRQDLLSTQEQLEMLVKHGIAMSEERDEDRLLEKILLTAMDMSNADAGTLYLRVEDDLHFKIVRNNTLDIKMGGTTGEQVAFPPVPLIDSQTGEPNYDNVVSNAALIGETILIEDRHEMKGSKFTGTAFFEEKFEYQSYSFLTVPLKPRGGEVIGVLQLINCKDPETGKNVPFLSEVISFVEALASQASVALDNQQLIENQRNLLDSFIQLIANAIDAKSPYTGGHCNRVPELAFMLAKVASDATQGPFADFKFTTEDEWREFRIGAWLHDCGKVTTPEYVVDKATKLETIYNRIHEIRMRFEVLWRDAEIDFYQSLAAGDRGKAKLKSELKAARESLRDDFAFICESNIGGEFMSPDKVERLKEIAKRVWVRNFDDWAGLSYGETERMELTPRRDPPAKEFLLDDKTEHIIRRDDPNPFKDNPDGYKIQVPEHLYNRGEIYNLSIAKGTLTEEERFKINDHVIQTIGMLGKLDFPAQLKRIPEYAGAHHETMNGKGYPRMLSRENMSVPARIMAIADIFEALTASDRPYKKAKTLSEAIRIMGFMRKDEHIDGELFELFLSSGVYKEYADSFLQKEQIDEADISQYIET